MPAQAYVNGRYSALPDAAVHVEDRGLQFGDSIYEVAAVMNGRLFDWGKHLARMESGTAALGFPPLPAAGAITGIARQLVRRARFGDGLLYIQVTRGAARRDHPFPGGVRPTLVMTARGFDFRQRVGQQARGIAAVSGPDDRWAHCDIKTTNLLAAVLAKQQAKQAGAFEAIFIGDGDVVREGASTNIYMVDSDGTIVTHPKTANILPGIMRDTALEQARAAKIPVREAMFTRAQALAAPELFLTSTTAPCLPIVRLDGQAIADGTPGPVTSRLAGLMWAEVERQTGWRA